MSGVMPGQPGAIAQRFAGIRMNSELIDKLDRKTATIGIVGLGYVGLPLMLRASRARSNAASTQPRIFPAPPKSTRLFSVFLRRSINTASPI
jgi:hypothetical protein